MKLNFLFFILTLCISGFSQVDFTKGIQGTWSYVDEYGKTQQIIISEDKWTVNENWSLNEEKTEWQLVKFSGTYKFVKSNKIHIIYHDRPREEEFVRIIELSDRKLIVEKSAYKSMRRSRKYEYKKE